MRETKLSSGEAGRKESGRELARRREHSVHDSAFASNRIPSYRSQMPLEYIEGPDAEWCHDFSTNGEAPQRMFVSMYVVA